MQGNRTLGARSVESLGILLLLGRRIVASRRSIALGSGAHGILLVVVLGRMSHGRFKQRLVVSPSLDEFLVELCKVIYPMLAQARMYV